MEFQQQGMKWIVENQGSSNGVVAVEVTDKKHQVLHEPPGRGVVIPQGGPAPLLLRDPGWVV